MWILILTLQFFVYIATWNIRFPHMTRFLFHELRKVSLGEFLDDIDIAGYILEPIGIKVESSSGAEEKVGAERLGSSDGIFSNFGATMILVSVLFVIIIAFVLLLYFLCKRTNCGERLLKLKHKVFWNPMIRYVILNALKFYMAGFVVFKATSSEESEVGSGAIVQAVAIVAIVNFSVYLFYRALKR